MESFLFQASIYLFAAVLAVSIVARIGFGSVLGYIAAGILIGPVLQLVGSETQDLQHFAEFGVVMMLFLIGLDLEPRKLWAMRHRLIAIGGLQILASALALAGVAVAFGQQVGAAIALGLTLALSSTASALQTLTETGLKQSEGGKSTFSVLLMQDVAVIPIIALLPLLALTSPARISPDGSIAHSDANDGFDGHALSFADALPAWGLTLVTLATVGAVVFAGIFLARPVFRFVHASRLREMYTAYALLIVVGISCVMMLVGLSPALGAFIAGVLLASSEFRHELESDLEPFKSLLVGLFFITVGAGINFAFLSAYWWSIVSMALLVILIKGLVLLGLSFIFRIKGRDRWLFVLILAQGGEFGFVLTLISVQSGVMQQDLAEMALVVIALSMLITPVLLFAARDLIGPEMRRSSAGQLGALKVFISYSRCDIQKMAEVAACLESEGFRVLYDSRSLPFGEKWKSELLYLIEQSDVVVWLVSESSVKSQWCKWELDKISRLGKKLVPVSVGHFTLDQLPLEIEERQILPVTGYFDSRNQDHVASVVDVLGSDYSWVKLYTRLSDRALAWDNAGRDSDRLLTPSELREAEMWRVDKPPLAPEPMPLVLDLIHSSRVDTERNAVQK